MKSLVTLLILLAQFPVNAAGLCLAGRRYPWETPRNNISVKSTQESPEGKIEYRLIFKRSGETLDWGSSTFEQRSQFFAGSLKEIFSEVECGMSYEKTTAGDPEVETRQSTSSTRMVFCVPAIIAQKFAEEEREEGRCISNRFDDRILLPSINSVSHDKLVDTSCLLSDKRVNRSLDGKTTRTYQSFPIYNELKGENLLKSTSRNSRGETVFNVGSEDAQLKYLKLLHYGFALSLENLLAKNEVEQLDKNGRIKNLSNKQLANRFLSCSPSVDISDLHDMKDLKRRINYGL